VVLVLVGVAEVFVGIFTLSLALVADGIQSFADAVVSPDCMDWLAFI